MKKLASIQSMVYMLMDKLGPIRKILVQKDDDWEEWGLEQLVENLQRYVERNPLKPHRPCFSETMGESQAANLIAGTAILKSPTALTV